MMQGTPKGQCLLPDWEPPNLKEQSKGLVVGIWHSLPREAVSGCCHLPFEILPSQETLSPGEIECQCVQGSLLELSLACQRLSLAITMNGIKGLKSPSQVSYLIYKYHSVKVSCPHTRYCNILFKLFPFINLYGDIVSALMWPGFQNHPITE